MPSFSGGGAAAAAPVRLADSFLVSSVRSGACWYIALAMRHSESMLRPTREACLSQIKMFSNTLKNLQMTPTNV
eukprot:CAMPEP_0115247146 /NCGR_PEP_ID=MMETSP0270-20121206/41395_1 /TAXON_ID=71861 /ORGANISM="Scrippsiella trochoidea, Strain CCMP3099" /LENGTH=73 /DNA_ID=CAMNT_0002662389 /DNA_START=36 /DNA_END=257 /DNA_ORIENTATION=+